MNLNSLQSPIFLKLKKNRFASWMIFWVRLLISRNKLSLHNDIIHDYYAVKNKLGGFISFGQQLEKPNKKALFLALAENFFQTKAEVMLAKAMQLQGYQVVIATSRKCRYSIKYYKLFGMKHFVFIEDFQNKPNSKYVLTDSEKLRLNPPYSFSGLLQLNIAGFDIGQHALSTVLSTFQCGHLDLLAPDVEQFIQQRLFESIGNITMVHSLLDAVDPQRVFFLEKGYLPWALFFDACLQRGLCAVQYCGAQETDAYVLKKYVSKEDKKQHPFSLSSHSWCVAKQMKWTPELDKSLMDMMTQRYELDTWYNRNRLRAKVTIRKPEEVKEILGLDPTKRTAIVFSHILWDATFFYGENLFDDYEKWLIATITEACKNPHLNWVIKLHPDYVWKLKRSGASLDEPDILMKTFGQLPLHIKLMLPDADINTFSLFGMTDYCITVRGTIGIEMACWGIPVITAGTGRYSHKGFTIDSSTPEEYRAKLISLHTFSNELTQDQKELARKFAFALFRLRPFKFSSFSTIFSDANNLKHPLFMNYSYNISGIDQLKSAEDLSKFAKWVDTLEAIDYLTPVEDLENI